ncbi:MAG: acyl-CoA dehydrogenase family protein [Rhodothermales bacterium]|nr:acyl-CoA dehydrogenase family protein [Rhodothermales bacterium]
MGPPTDRLRDLLPRVEAFVEEALKPLEAPLLAHDFDALDDALPTVRQEARARGLWLPQMPEEAGGLGLSLVEFAHVSERLGTTPLGHVACNCQAPDAGNMEILHDHATAAQRERFLAPLLRGEVRSCFAMTEPEHAGSNPAVLGTTARTDGGDYVLDGHKWFTTGFDGAAFVIVMAVTDPEAESPYARASQFIVPADAPGLEHVRRIPVMGEAGRGWFSHSEIRFDGCRVPKANRLGEEGAGFLIAQERLGPGRIHHCMRWVGICERAFALMCERAATREVAPGKPLGTRQAVQHWIAESRAGIDAARLLVLDAARTIEAEGAYAARAAISAIKFFVADVLMTVLDRAIQTHGALGVTTDTPLAFWYAHERGARIYDGPDEVHKSVVAREALKPYGVRVRS